jgi:hypothetical protein
LQNTEVERLAEKLRNVWDDVYNANIRSFANQKSSHDKTLNEHEFHVGDRVLLHNTTVKQGQTKKLSPQWTGPYPILKLVSRVLVQLQLENRNINVQKNRIKIYQERTHDTAPVCSQLDQPQLPAEPATPPDTIAETRPQPARRGLRDTAARRLPGFFKLQSN